MKRMIYLDEKSNEIENILNGTKDVIMRGANIKKYPYDMIHKNDHLYILQNDKTGIVYASANIKEAIFYTIQAKVEMENIINKYRDRVKLSKKRIDYIKARKYISVFELDDIRKEYAEIDHSQYGEVEDWIVVKDITD